MKVYVVSQGYTPIGVFKDRETALAVSKGANGSLFGGEDDCHVKESPWWRNASISPLTTSKPSRRSSFNAERE